METTIVDPRQQSVNNRDKTFREIIEKVAEHGVLELELSYKNSISFRAAWYQWKRMQKLLGTLPEGAEHVQVSRTITGLIFKQKGHILSQVQQQIEGKK